VIINVQLDGCIVWNAHNTVFGSKRSAICATKRGWPKIIMPNLIDTN